MTEKRLRRIRKAIAAGAGVLLTGLLVWASSVPDVQQALEGVLPPQLLPFAGWLAGAIATVAAVYRSTNAGTLPVSAPPAAGALGESEASTSAGTTPEPAPVLPPRESPSVSAGAELVADSPAAAATDPTDGATPAVEPAVARVALQAPPARLEVPTSFIPLPRQ